LDKYNRDAQRISFVGNDNQSPLQVGSAEWNRGVRQFAGQLKHALQRLRRNCRPIFLGKIPHQGSQDLRSWCRVELERRYFRIVPESLASLDSQEAIRAQLQEASLAIHFLGGADTPALEAIYSSAHVCYGPTVLFQPFGAELAPHEEIWLFHFEQDLPGSTARYQRLAGKNNQELIRLVEEMMSGGTPAAVVETGRGLALICEKPDLLEAQQLRETITATGKTEVHFPEFLTGKFTPTQNCRKWQDLFKRGKQLLFYHGASERAWLEAKWRQAELDNPKAPREWYVAPPDLESKRRQYPEALWRIAQVVEHLDEEGVGH
jgi:hypothetical protein